MKKVLIFITMIVFLGGCGLKRVDMRPLNYRLEPQYPLQVNQTNNEKVLRIQRVEGDSTVMTRSILYKQDGALQPYKYARWSELPSTRLQEIFIESIEKQKIFRATVSSRSFAMAHLLLESDLENFEQVFKDGKSYIHINIRFRLIKRNNAELIDSHLIDSVYPIKQKDIQGVIFAYNKAVEQVIVDLIGWLNEESK